MTGSMTKRKARPDFGALKKKYHFFCFFPIDFMASGFALFLLWKLAPVISPQIMAD